MPIISIIANWLKGWGVPVPTPPPYAEWADNINLVLMKNSPIDILFYNASPSINLMPSNGINLSLIEGNNISVKLMSTNPIGVVVENQ